MFYRFQFKGGVDRDTSKGQLDKFLMFFVIEGKETPFYKMRKEGLVQKPIIFIKDNSDYYETNFSLIKIFMGQSGFGIRKRYLSFYIRLTKDGNPTPSIEIKSFNINTGFYFRGRGAILTKEEVKKEVKDEISVNYYLHQSPLPKEIMERIISVDTSYLKKGVRAIRVKRRNKYVE